MDAEPELTGTAATAEMIEARRRSFTTGAGTYDEVRPPWPAGTLEWVLGTPVPQAGSAVLDLGAGTGLGSRTLAELGYRVTAVDASADMIATLEASKDRLAPQVADRITAKVAPAEAIPLEDGSVVATVCLQAWHWFDPEVAARECARVIAPGGWLGLAWHTWDGETSWLHDLAEIVGRPEMMGRQTGALPELPGFGPSEATQLPLAHELTVDQLVRLASSWSFVAVNPNRDDVLERVRALGERLASPTLVFPNITDCYRAQKLYSHRNAAD